MFSFSPKVPIISTLPTNSSLFVRLESELAVPLIASSTFREIKLQVLRIKMCMRVGEGDCSVILTSCWHTQESQTIQPKIPSTDPSVGQLCSLRLPLPSHPTPFMSGRTLQIHSSSPLPDAPTSTSSQQPFYDWAKAGTTIFAEETKAQRGCGSFPRPQWAKDQNSRSRSSVSVQWTSSGSKELMDIKAPCTLKSTVKMQGI